jgi:Cupin-like domain
MSWLSEPEAIAERSGVDFAVFHEEIRPAAKPIVLRRLVPDWPCVHAGRESPQAMIDYMLACGSIRPVKAMAAAPSEKGRFFYTPDLSGFNFFLGEGQLDNFFKDLLSENAKGEAGYAMAVQSEVLRIVSPRFASENHLNLLPDIDARIWISNKSRVAPHYDLSENVACNVAGRRQFVLFPPEQISNLYLGPLEKTPAGTPASLVDVLNPDLDRFPRFVEAWKSAQAAILEPGDAIYIPYGWWHAVESLEPLNILVNYWWNNQHEKFAHPYNVLLSMIAAYRHLPDEQRRVWRSITDYYAFGDINPGEHLPDPVKGMLAPYSPALMERMMRYLKSTLG